MGEAADTAGLEAIFNGSAGLDWAAESVLMISVDQSLRVVSNVFLAAGDAPRCISPPGRTLAELFPADPLQSIVAPHVAAAMAGDAAEVDVAWEDPDALRIRLSFLPRFQGAGRRRGFFITARNVAATERHAREVDASNARLAAILDNAADGVILIDQNGLIQEANGAAAVLFGWSHEQLIGRPVTSLMDSDVQADHQKFIDRYLQTGVSGILNVGPRKLPGRRRDGERVWFELSVGEAWIGGERTFVGVCRDIGERLAQEEALRRSHIALEETVFELKRVSADLERQKQRSEALVRAAEKARQHAEDANDAKSRFLATVSHELRTPLNGVLAITDLLAAQDMPAGASQLIDIIRGSGRDLLGLLNEILDLARIEAGALTMALAPFSPNELLRSTAEVWRPAAKSKGLDLQVTIADLPPALLGDAGRLRQVLSNLLNNAIKFTDRGYVRLEVDALERDGAVALTITVTDSGAGIDPSLRERLFEPFSRGRQDVSGAGLGLSICREIVGLMRGAIFAEPNPDGGARMIVEIELPIAQPTAAGDAPRSNTQAPAILEAAPSLRVLVAEDHPTNRQVIALLLDQLGADYRMAEDGEQAVKAAAAEPFDLILMDVRMPRMDGLAATRAIRTGGGPNAHSPVIAVTADAMPGDASGIMAAGVDAILPKPITLSGLAASMDAALRQMAS